MRTTASRPKLPASLFLSAKPAWWADLPWPAIGPDPDNPSVLLNGKIPARVRFDSMGSRPKAE